MPPEETSWLLTDEFVQFSSKIASILEKKKAKKAELKTFYDKIQVDVKALEDEAKQAEVEFENWKKVQGTGSE